MELPTPPPSLPSATVVFASRRPSIRAAPHTRTPSRGRTRTRSRAAPPLPLAHTLLSPSRAPQRRLPPPLPLLSPTTPAPTTSPLSIVGNRAKEREEEMLFPMSPVLSQMHAHVQVQQVQQAHYSGVQPQAIWSPHDRLAARGRTRTRGRARTRSFVREVQVVRSGAHTVPVPVPGAFATTVPAAAALREQFHDAKKRTTGVPLGAETKSAVGEARREREHERLGEEGEEEEEDPFLYTFPVFSSSPLVRAQDWRARRARTMQHHHHHRHQNSSSSTTTPCAKNVDLSTFGAGEREMEYFHCRLFGDVGRGRSGAGNASPAAVGGKGEEDVETTLLLSDAFRSHSLSTTTASRTSASVSVSPSASPSRQESSSSSSPPSSISASESERGSGSMSTSPPDFPPSLFYTPNANVSSERTPTPAYASTHATQDSTQTPAPARRQHTSTPAAATTSMSTSFASYTSRWIPRSLLASFPALTRAGRAAGPGSSPTAAAAAVTTTTTRVDGEGASEKVSYPKLADEGDGEHKEKGEKEDTSSAPCHSPTSPAARAEETQAVAQARSTPVRIRVDELAEYIRARRTVSTPTPASIPAQVGCEVAGPVPVPVPIYPAKARFGRAREGGVCIPCAGAGGDGEFYAFGDGEVWADAADAADAREVRGGAAGRGERDGEDVGVERGRTRVNVNSVRAV